MKTLLVIVLSLLLVPFKVAYADPPIDSVQGDTVTLTVQDTFGVNALTGARDDANLAKWDDLDAFLVNSNYKTYVLNWAGYGGYVEAAHDLERAMQIAESQGKTIIINLIGASYSAHAIAVCYASEVLNHNNQVLMFHADADEGGHRMQSADTTISADLSQCESKHILLPRDIKMLWAGYEVWTTTYKVHYEPDSRPL